MLILSFNKKRTHYTFNYYDFIYNFFFFFIHLPPNNNINGVLNSKSIATNVDNIFIGGCYDVNPNTQGTLPSNNGYALLFVRTANTTWVYQDLIYTDTINFKHYHRMNINNNGWTAWEKYNSNSDLSLKQLDGVDVYTLEDGRYYITNGINMPPNHPHGYVIVHRLLGDYACMFYIDPYLPDTTLAFNKQGAGTWLGWKNFITDNSPQKIDASTFNSEYIKSDHSFFFAYKANNLLCYTIDTEILKTIPDATTLFTIPESIRPKERIIIPILNGANQGAIAVNSDGTVKAWGTISYSASWYTGNAFGFLV
ncbi:MAG TPA: hypothetical protein IAC14_01960 [Candidatus Scybalomonas excrementigallinarum]|nr:hypothetical protein [Candidatus Scybalomonas excrementigallinarum]